MQYLKKIQHYACLTGLLYVSLAVAQVNLILNPGMEAWSGGIPDDWNYSGSSYLSESSGPVHGGGHSVEFQVPTTSTTAELSQDISVSGGNICSFACWIYDNEPFSEIGLIINWRHAGGSLGWINSSHSSDSGSWQQLKINNAAAPSEATIARIRIRAYQQSGIGGDIVYADDAEFYLDASLAVSLSEFTVCPLRDSHLIEWRTESETGTLGFHILSSNAEHGPFEPVTTAMIAGRGNQSAGAVYSYPVYPEKIDEPVWYRLEEITESGEHVVLGTVPVHAYARKRMPDQSCIAGNFPNPFNPCTQIEFQLSEENAGCITLDVFNVRGQKIITLADRIFKAGKYLIPWSGQNTAGMLVPSGIYFARLSSNQGLLDVKKLLKCE
ncbi:T9SS type A sorting domain-containing protein [bacterium]|nr:T9SS type A sorting domain-containing protein [bacterium]